MITYIINLFVSKSKFSCMRKKYFLSEFLILCVLLTPSFQAFSQKKTYCNPIDIDYSYMGVNAAKKVSYRSGADPAVINFKGRYFMFVTRSFGYWYSDDMSQWNFVEPQNWYFRGSNAPAAAVYGDEIILYGDPSGRGVMLHTDNPELGNWEGSYGIMRVPGGIQDPAIFVDDNQQVYLYEESSNKWPIRVIELDTGFMFLPKGKEKDLFNLQPESHGWERFGQDHHSDLKPYIEGPWMVKHGDTYYLEYGAPGTQWNVYADGVYTSKNPMGPFEYAPYNPISYKPGGFLKGSGHGSTVKDKNGQYWHYATMAISVNYKFERRLGMFPAGFEEDGQMYVNTAYGDYPHFLPDVPIENHKRRFSGWMLLSKGKKVTTNSTLVGVSQNIIDEVSQGYMLESEADVYSITNINDENLRTMWVAESNSDTVQFEMDLGREMTINAVQVNFLDFNAAIYGREKGLKQQFTIKTSGDGKSWNSTIDFSENEEDRPHAYIELPNPVKARFLRFENQYFPNQYLAIGEFRVFGSGNGKLPKTPRNFEAKRQEDERDAQISWDQVKGAQGYVLYWGIASDRLNNSVMVYDENEYELRALNKGVQYFYQVEAFNENGVSKKTEILNDLIR